eukprot:TRINITY_DN10253_c0_g1_i8.p1 TRINITY_DN10253_c0_g1~~TRINITY_DN10253_c0_g1_i8.p1  ORF type:complete len:226 (+),score=105.18 TRINITY_DN10253_c0_g1_i8:57-734(+)
MADSVEAPISAVEAPVHEKAKVKKAVAAATKGKKKVSISAGKAKNEKPTYSAMVTKAILELKEKKGSSRQSIMKYLQGNYKVEAASAPLLMNKALKKMTTDGRLMAGAQAGKTGAGCYKVSTEEKTKIKQMEKAAAKKLAAAEKAPGKKVSTKKSSAGKKVAVKTGAGKKKLVKAAAKKKVVGKKSVPKKTGAKKAMKKVSKASAGAKTKKGSAKPKKVAKKSKK